MTELLTPDWQEARPSPADVQKMWARIALTPVDLPSDPFAKFIEQVRKSHDNGGAYLAAFDIGPAPVFDWYASRNRLSEDLASPIFPSITSGLVADRAGSCPFSHSQKPASSFAAYSLIRVSIASASARSFAIVSLRCFARFSASRR